ncbi:hypothetical protein D9615_010227 [Tricholomella constricta]|uniref:Uncharacterized protein n=1 Tax=Tricholomella constricta TaxID=117010 RepID=A0A8H5GQW1_9AGAR|nr:hypothetical protein D9615_010227 [Tricholomella constricta]
MESTFSSPKADARLSEIATALRTEEFDAAFCRRFTDRTRRHVGACLTTIPIPDTPTSTSSVWGVLLAQRTVYSATQPGHSLRERILYPHMHPPSSPQPHAHPTPLGPSSPLLSRAPGAPSAPKPQEPADSTPLIDAPHFLANGC